jgi:hypothetical protein
VAKFRSFGEKFESSFMLPIFSGLIPAYDLLAANLKGGAWVGKER